MSKKILITGGKGFIGERLVSLLNTKDYKVTTIDKTDGFDLSEKCNFEKIENFDLLVHLAAMSFVPDSYKNPECFYRTNFLSTLTALELCRNNNAKMVYISSYVYGVPQYLPIDENHEISAFNPYAQSKVICENLCKGYHRDFKLPLIILRPFNIFGCGQNEKFLISKIFNQLIDGESTIELKDPNPKRDYVHISDVIRAIESAINSNVNFGIYNICSNYSISVKEVTEVINRNVKKPVKFNFDIFVERESEIGETLGSYEKIFNELGWKPELTFEEGIKKDIIDLGL